MIFSPFERMVAGRYLRSRRAEGFVSVIAGFSLLGISLGVATLIIVMAVMNGFRADLLGRILGLNGHVVVQSLNGPLNDPDAVIAKIGDIPTIVSIAPAIEGQVLVTGNGRALGALVRGMRPADLQKRTTLSAHIEDGSLNNLEENDGVAIGYRLARQLGLAVGDSITLLSPKGSATAFGTVPRIKAYKVAAIFKVDMYEYDSSFVYMSLAAAGTFFQTPGQATHIEVIAQDPETLQPLVNAIAQRLGPAYDVADWTRNNGSFFAAVEVERTVMFLILTLIIVVAAFNVVSGLIMLVKDKGRDIAILRTMGATRGMVMRIFFLTGASVGVMGTGLGVILGLVFSQNIEAIRLFIQRETGATIFDPSVYFLSHLPAKVDPHEVLMVVVMSLGLSLLATLYPAWRAARLYPVEALRYE